MLHNFPTLSILKILLQSRIHPFTISVMFKSKLITLTIIFLAFIIFWIFFKFSELLFEYTWNQEAQLIVTTEDGIFTGTNVMNVTWRKNPFSVLGAKTWDHKITGEAPFVLLPDGRIVVALLGDDPYRPSGLSIALLQRNGLRGTLAEQFKDVLVNKELQSAVHSAPTKSPPYIVVFEDALNRKSGKELILNNQNDEFVPITEVTLEIHHSPLPVSPPKISESLLWLKSSLEIDNSKLKTSLMEDSISLQNAEIKLNINREQFIQGE